MSKHDRPRSRSQRRAPQPPPRTDLPRIDREKTCPFLLRVFHRENTPHPLHDFEHSKTPASEVQIYTWLDSTLREISEHIQRDVESARKRDTELEFSLMYMDFNGGLRRKALGCVRVGSKGPDDLKTLQQLRFFIGDYICLAIVEPVMQERRKHDEVDYRKRDVKSDEKKRERRREERPPKE